LYNEESGNPSFDATIKCRHQRPLSWEAAAVGGRVARWFVFKPKIKIWVNF
jgi:cytidylate kinase